MRLGSEEELENGVGVAGRTAEQEMVTCWATKTDKMGGKVQLGGLKKHLENGPSIWSETESLAFSVNYYDVSKLAMLKRWVKKTCWLWVRVRGGGSNVEGIWPHFGLCSRVRGCEEKGLLFGVKDLKMKVTDCRISKTRMEQRKIFFCADFLFVLMKMTCFSQINLVRIGS